MKYNLWINEKNNKVHRVSISGLKQTFANLGCGISLNPRADIMLDVPLPEDKELCWKCFNCEICGESHTGYNKEHHSKESHSVSMCPICKTLLCDNCRKQHDLILSLHKEQFQNDN